MEAALTGEPVSAATAREWHLVNRLVPRGEALSEALGLAERIAANAPLSVQASKRLVRAAAGGASESELWAANAELCTQLLACQDAAEGMRAFAERRSPRWRGR